MKYVKIGFKSDLELDYDFLGSAIRGVFGVGLKNVVCINPTKECNDCFAKDGCLFYDFFEKAAPKYRLDLNLGGKVDFNLYLFEEYASKYPYVLSAIYKAFKEIGITKKRLKPDFKLYLNDKLIFDKEFMQIENKILEFNVDEYKENGVLLIKTPIRIKQNNLFLRDNIPLEVILRSIHHRYLKLTNKPITKLPFTPKYNVTFSNFNFLDFKRFSNRQKTSMKLGGVVGSIQIEDMDENTYKYLKLGELIGVGKQVTFGLGKIELV